MKYNNTVVNEHYGSEGLCARILNALTTAGKDIDNLTREDIATFEEFHIGGREATRELATLASLSEGTSVLDIGCGIGGPARTLSAEFGCVVTGLDLTKEFCKAAGMLTERVGLSNSVRFVNGSVLDMPFEDNNFDVVWMQHVGMNIENKSKLIDEVTRLLKPGGRFVFHEVMMGGGNELHFPVFWARDTSISFLESPSAFRDRLVEHTFTEAAWNDVTSDAKQFFLKLTETIKKSGPPSLGLGIIVGQDVPTKVKNLLLNLSENRIVVVRGCFSLPEN